MKIERKPVKVFLAIVLVVILLVGAIYALPAVGRFAVYLFRLFMPFIFAYVFALIIDPLVRKLQSRFKMPRSVTAWVVILVIIGVVGGGLSWIGYIIVNEVRSLSNNLPQIYDNLLSSIDKVKNSFKGFYEVMPMNIQEAVAEFEIQITEKIAQLINSKSLPLVTGAGSAAKSLPKVLISTIVFVLSTFFMISDFERVKSFVKKPFGKRHLTRLTEVSLQIKTYLGGYVRAQGTIMLVVFVILFLSLSLLDINFALLIAIGTAFLDALPFFGSGAVLWPWSVISFVSGDIRMGICTIVIYVVIFVVRQLIEPKIVSKNIGTNPLLTLISMYLGYRLLSVGGMILGPVIMLLIVSLYRAGVFDGLISFTGAVKCQVKKQCSALKNKIKTFWESE